MALHEQDREDLLAEAQALTPRGEWQVAGEVEPVTAGLRRGGCSIYFGGDPCYHFDEEGRLRRAFAGGFLYRTQGATLARLERVRSERRVELLRVDLTEPELQSFLDDMQRRLAQFLSAAATGAARLVRSVSEAADPAAEILPAVRRAAHNRQLAPAIPTRRD